MRLTLFLRLLACLTLVSAATAEPVSYSKRIRPLLERNCVACHACFDAPCQLKLSSPEGLDRGASQDTVYAAARLKPQDPTRLFLDADSVEAWRGKGFFSVTEGGAESLMAKMLKLGQEGLMEADKPLPKTLKLGTAHQDVCPTNAEYSKYAKDRPLEGMPYGVAPLPEDEYADLNTWLAEGAPVDATPNVSTSEEQAQINAWEDFLNQSSNRGQLVGRYIYEHLYLGHLHFEGAPEPRFFEIVRSSTPPGAPIKVAVSRRPNTPVTGETFYRIRPMQGVVVHKTHITFPLSAAKLKRYQALFFDTEWDVDELPGYELADRINPFITFEPIPARSRYQFLLDNAKYFVRNFIRGPVCRGQIATDVIDDHFHAVFQDPDHDLFLLDKGYAKRQTPSLGMPGVDIKRLIRMTPDWLKAEQKYTNKRVEAYKRYPGTNWDHVWNGDDVTPDALLTIFRHFDSSTVELGLKGETPKTIWMIDYPILERIYYLLVVNFDVFGPAKHQVETRLYFDLLRAESEANFLRYIPVEQRQKLRNYWYRGKVATVKRRMVYESIDTETETEIQYRGGNPLTEFTQGLRRYAKKVTQPNDYLNRCTKKPCGSRKVAKPRQQTEALLQRLVNIRAADAPFILQLPELTYLRISTADGKGEGAYALTRNKAHRNVAFMMKEGSRLEPERDYLTLTKGPVGSYPNFIFSIPEAEVETFVNALLMVRSEISWNNLVEGFGVRRMSPEFWDNFHFFTDWMKEHDPLEAGIYDMNRYENY